MFGPEILARTLSATARPDKYKNRWQYLSRGDHHSKVACWSIVFDLLVHCDLFRSHVERGKVGFGVNHEMRDFKNDRKKDLDLVLCTPASGVAKTSITLETMAQKLKLLMTKQEAEVLSDLPSLQRSQVGSVLVALEAKACMTAHQRALPRLYDELNSSHLTIHGASEHAIAAGFMMINVAEQYLSPDLNKKNRPLDPDWSKHHQPRDASLAVGKVKQLPRRSRVGEEGFDAFAILVVHRVNDGSPVVIHAASPQPEAKEIYAYSSMIDRVCGLYSARFGQL